MHASAYFYALLLRRLGAPRELEINHAPSPRTEAPPQRYFDHPEPLLLLSTTLMLALSPQAGSASSSAPAAADSGGCGGNRGPAVPHADETCPQEVPSDASFRTPYDLWRSLSGSTRSEAATSARSGKDTAAEAREEDTVPGQQQDTAAALGGQATAAPSSLHAFQSFIDGQSADSSGDAYGAAALASSVEAADQAFHTSDDDEGTEDEAQDGDTSSIEATQVEAQPQLHTDHPRALPLPLPLPLPSPQAARRPAPAVPLAPPSYAAPTFEPYDGRGTSAPHLSLSIQQRNVTLYDTLLVHHRGRPTLYAFAVGGAARAALLASEGSGASVPTPLPPPPATLRPHHLQPLQQLTLGHVPAPVSQLRPLQ